MLEQWGDEMVQSSLPAPADPGVVVLNISDLPSKSKNEGGEQVRITSRAALTRLIDALAKLQPTVIGVDIDLSPRHGAYASPDDDPKFFEDLLRTRQTSNVPIYVGAYTSLSMPHELWLGASRYAPLAASVALFHGDNRTVPATIGSGRDAGPTMSEAIASSAAAPDRPDGISGWLARKESAWHHRGFTGEEFVVNYGAIREMRQATFEAIAPSDVANQYERLHNHAVILADTTAGKATDICEVPRGVLGTDEDVIPCGYVHASAAFTLIQAPLYRMTLLGRVLWDLAIAVVIFGSVALLRLYYARSAAKIAAERLYALGFVAFTLVLVLVCVIFVRQTHIVWDDFVLIAIVLLFHTSIERRATAFWSWFRNSLPSLVFERRAE